MKTIQEQIAIMQHFANGGAVELYSRTNEKWVDVKYPKWNWHDYDYRIKEEKKTVTIEKWLIERNGDIIALEGNENSFLSWSDWKKLKLLDKYEIEL